MKMKNSLNILLLMIFIAGMSLAVSAQKRAYGKVCGDPTAACKSASDFQPYELAFELPNNPVIFDSELFYAVILKSVKTKTETDCQNAFSEEERINLQRIFPRNKVFTLKCFETGGIYYTNTANNVVFMGIYAGRTLAEAKSFLKRVQSQTEYSGAIIKRMRAGINGT
jgi:hypothetical protein